MTQPVSNELVQAHVWISGLVQGVGYRMATWETAIYLGLKGWVRNLADGRVEAVFEGDRATVEEMVRWCHQGPKAAKVKSVEVQMGDAEGFSGFEVRRG